MDKENNISLEEMKKIVHEIIEEESKKYNIQIGAFPITFIEYYTDYVFKQKYKLIQIPSLLTVPITADGFNDCKGNTVMFLNRTNRIQKIEKKIFRLAESCYHEARHSIQQDFDKYSYEGFLYAIEKYLKQQPINDYNIAHDKYSFEIGANLYGVTKAKEYLKAKYPHLYEKDKARIERIEKRYYLDYMTYDASDTIERIVQTLKWQLKFHNAKKIKGMDRISSVLSIFLNENLSFKSLNQIIQNDKFKELDKRIIYAFLSSKSFLENLDVEKLKEDELSLLTESLQYTNTVYQNQQKTIEEFKKQDIITLKEYLTSQKNMLQKYSFIKRYFTSKVSEKLKRKFNFVRNEQRRREHIKTIPSYLEKTKRLVKPKTSSNGYLTIGTCYIISIMISILTIIYILIK